MVYCFLVLREFDGNKKDVARKIVLPLVGLVYIALSSNLILNGYGILLLSFVAIVVELIRNKRLNIPMIIGCCVMGMAFLIPNFDLIKELFGKAGFISHREEFISEPTGKSFGELAREIFWDGISHNESLHKYVFLAIVVAFFVCIFNKKIEKKIKIAFVATISTLISLGLLYIFFSCDFYYKLIINVGGILKSFQFERFFYLMPGAWYILFGISLSIIIKSFGKLDILGLILATATFVPTLFFVAKNPNGIFYQNINEINNGNSVTGYISWERLYAEDLMEHIKDDIGKKQAEYRVASLGICPVVSLMNGFYTIDGYSNNYPLEYKHAFYGIQKNELALNDYSNSYFNDWGSRCYLFYHEWGNAFMLGKQYSLIIDDLYFDFKGMKELGCQYLFSAAEIIGAERYNLDLVGYYDSPQSYWGIWVYELI